MTTPLKFVAALALVGLCLEASAQEGAKMTKDETKAERQEREKEAGREAGLRKAGEKHSNKMHRMESKMHRTEGKRAEKSERKRQM